MTTNTKENQLDIDARRIANKIVFNSLHEAQTDWNKTIEKLKYWEAAILRDKIKSLVDELENAKTHLDTLKKDALYQNI